MFLFHFEDILFATWTWTFEGFKNCGGCQTFLICDRLDHFNNFLQGVCILHILYWFCPLCVGEGGGGGEVHEFYLRYATKKYQCHELRIKCKILFITMKFFKWSRLVCNYYFLPVDKWVCCSNMLQPLTF